MDSSRKLILICAIYFIISLYLTLYACVQIFDAIGVKKTRAPNYRALFLPHLALV
jgi:hypothetical protein